MKRFSKAAAVFFAVALLLTIMTATVFASTKTEVDTIELRTQSVLLIDRSGSMEEQEPIDDVLAKIDQSAFDAVVFFDQRFSTNTNFTGGGNSHICEAIVKAIAGGFEHITVVTDGEQWPQDYSALGLYTDIDLTIHLVEEDKESAEFIQRIQNCLFNSNLKVVRTDGSEEIILDDYQPPIYEIQIEVPVIPEQSESEAEQELSESDSDSQKVVVVDEDGKCYWWVALILAAIIAALFDFIHELITRGRNEEKEKSPQTTTNPTPKPMPVKAVVQIAQGAHVVADFSGSMAAQQSETANACINAQKGSGTVLCFGHNVSEHRVSELKGIKAAGQTPGWEAMEYAGAKGWNKIVLVSDLKFNGKYFNENAFPKKFKKITVVTPSNYNTSTLENLKKIADEVEVLPL